MIRVRVILYILLITLSNLDAQTIGDRFKVPIYLRGSLSLGYDNNIFRLSDFEKKQYHQSHNQ